MSRLPPDEAAVLRAANARLREAVKAKDAEIGVLRQQVEALAALVAELRARLGQNPGNSSKPPSSEGLAKPATRSLRKKSGRKPGRPKGQPGVTLELSDRLDEVVTHEPGRCSRCGAGLFGAPVTGAEGRQVIDLPEVIRALATEHLLICRLCSCGTVTSGSTPADVCAPVRYGPRISARCARTYGTGSSCPAAAPARRWPSCSGCRFRRMRSAGWMK